MADNTARTRSKKLDEIARKRNNIQPVNPKMSQKRLITMSVIAIAAIVVIIFLSIKVFAGDSNNNESSEESNSSTKIEKVEKTTSGKSIDEDRKDAMSAAAEILNSSKTKDGEDYEKRLKELEKGDMSSIPDDLNDKIRFTDAFKRNDELKVVAYQSLIALNATMLEGKEAKPVSDDAWKSVYVDQEQGIAYVPMGVFSGTNVPFSFEMVYDDGEWKLLPYSFIESVKMSSSFQGDGKSPSVPPEE